MANAKLTQQAVDSAQAAIDLNMQRMRLESTDDQQTRLFHLLISLIEWCEVRRIDFDAAVSEVRQHFLEAEGRCTKCGGTGLLPGVRRCPDCNGEGRAV